MRKIPLPILHLIGDYILQTDWMANNKTTNNVAAATHAITYTAPFLTRTRNWKKIAIVGGTHYLIDRYRLARYVVWAKNQLSPLEDRSLTNTGIPPSTPPFMAVWLMIIADNTIHLLINDVVIGDE